MNFVYKSVCAGYPCSPISNQFYIYKVFKVDLRTVVIRLIPEKVMFFNSVCKILDKLGVKILK